MPLRDAPPTGRRSRMTPRQRQAQETRDRSNRRRHETTASIRKQRKSGYLARKRGIAPSAHAGTSSEDAAVREFTDALLASLSDGTVDALQRLRRSLVRVNAVACSDRRPRSFSASLSALSTDGAPAFHAHDSPNAMLFLDRTQSPDVARQLVDLLARFLRTWKEPASAASQPSPSPAVADDTVVGASIGVLVLLTALPTNASSSTIRPNEYYANVLPTWCTLLVEPPAPQSASQTPAQTSIVETLKDLVQFICDQPTMPNNDSLLSVLDSVCMIFGNLAGDDGVSVRRSLKQARIANLLIRILRQFAATHSLQSPKNAVRMASTAAWALTNLIRNDPTTFANEYCSENLLSPSLLKTLVSQPHDIALSTQTAWIIASLTNREDDTVTYLCTYDATFCPTLVQVLQTRLTASDIHAQQILPLLQSIGHIASFEEYIAPLLTSTSIVKILAKTFEGMLASNYSFMECLPSTWPRGDVTQLVLHIAWLAGCLLFDARRIGHPSTEIAFPKLVPQLIDLIIRHLNNGLILEESAAILRALWNAWDVSAVQLEAGDNSQHNSGQSTPSIVPLRDCPCIDGLMNLLPALVDLIAPLARSDTDSLMKVMCFMDLVLRNADSFQTSITYVRQQLEELQIVDKLELVCDTEGMPEELSELAANLLDDFFDGNDYEEEYDVSLVPSSNADGFDFGLADASGPLGFDAHVANGMPDNIGGAGRGRGMGRGRGVNVPAWMSRQPN